MEAIEWIIKATTLIGAVVAAWVSYKGYLLQKHAKDDEIHVSLSWPEPEGPHFPMVSVVSRTDHPIELEDFGFIEKGGAFVSLSSFEAILDFFEIGQFCTIGHTRLEKRNDRFQRGVDRREEVIGAFARTTAQRRLTVYLGRSASPADIFRVWWRQRRRRA